MYVVWITDLEDYNLYAGAATTKEKAERIVKKALKLLKNKNSVPDEFGRGNFEIERIKDGKLSEFVLEYE